MICGATSRSPKTGEASSATSGEPQKERRTTEVASLRPTAARVHVSREQQQLTMSLCLVKPSPILHRLASCGNNDVTGGPGSGTRTLYPSRPLQPDSPSAAIRCTTGSIREKSQAAVTTAGAYSMLPDSIMSRNYSARASSEWRSVTTSVFKERRQLQRRSFSIGDAKLESRSRRSLET